MWALSASCGQRPSGDLGHPVCDPLGVQEEPHPLVAEPGRPGSLQASAVFARKSRASLCQGTASSLLPAQCGKLLGKLYTVLEEIQNWGNGNEKMIQTDSARDWGKQLEMLKKTKTLINILVLYCSLPPSTNQQYSETLFF